MNFGLEVVCDSHIFDGTHYARWKHHMLDHFRALGSKFWWIIAVGFTRALDESNLTQAQEDCQTLDAQALYFLTNALKDEMFGRVMTSKSAHDMWMALKYLYGVYSI